MEVAPVGVCSDCLLPKRPFCAARVLIGQLMVILLPRGHGDDVTRAAFLLHFEVARKLCASYVRVASSHRWSKPRGSPSA